MATHRIGRIERRILELVEGAASDVVNSAQDVCLSADDIARDVYRCWPERHPTRAEYVSVYRAMHSFVRKFPQYALIGGKGRTPLYLYEPDNPRSARTAAEWTERRRAP
jgi:hypothetical protein